MEAKSLLGSEHVEFVFLVSTVQKHTCWDDWWWTSAGVSVSLGWTGDLSRCTCLSYWAVPILLPKQVWAVKIWIKKGPKTNRVEPTSQSLGRKHQDRWAVHHRMSSTHINSHFLRFILLPTGRSCILLRKFRHLHLEPAQLKKTELLF